MMLIRSRLMVFLAIAAGALLLGYGYGLHRTTLVVRTDLGPEPPKPEPAAEPAPDKVKLPADDDWDDEAKPPAAADDWDDEGGPLDKLNKELEAASGSTCPTPQEDERVVAEWGLVRGAVMGIVVRLPDGRLALTWLGDTNRDAPACPT